MFCSTSLLNRAVIVGQVQYPTASPHNMSLGNPTHSMESPTQVEKDHLPIHTKKGQPIGYYSK